MGAPPAMPAPTNTPEVANDFGRKGMHSKKAPGQDRPCGATAYAATFFHPDYTVGVGIVGACLLTELVQRTWHSQCLGYSRADRCGIRIECVRQRITADRELVGCG